MLLFISLGATVLAATKWGPVDPRELADPKPQVDPEAGAEILLREVEIRHEEVDSIVWRFHVRAKIYSERGLEEFAKVELDYGNGTTIDDVKVRTIKPDGSIIELGKKDVYDRERIKFGEARVKVKAFSPAGLAPGAIVEYFYTETVDSWSWYVPMSFQSDLPARLVRFRFRPISASDVSYPGATQMVVGAMFMNCPDQPLKTDKEDYYVFEMRNVPAAKTEPFQPPLLNCQAVAVIYYSFEETLPPKEYWAKIGRELHARMLSETKATKLVRATLATIIGPTDTEEQKLRKLYDYCRTRLVNRASAAASFTREQRKKLRANETASDTLKAGSGTPEDLNMAFVALARAAGFDARTAGCNDRSIFLFNPRVTQSFMLSDLVCAVQVGGQWRFYDPGSLYLAAGTLAPKNTATSAVIAAPKDAAPMPVPPASADSSGQKRVANFHLSADGTLEGDVTISFSGAREVAAKNELDWRTPGERETYIREEIQATLKAADVSDIKVENAADPLAPLKISYHLAVPGYADRTGSRLFFQPAVFQKNAPSLLPDATRRKTLLFHPGYSDSDEIRVALPDGFELEEGSSPGSVNLGSMGRYAIEIAYYRKSRSVDYRRTFVMNDVYVEAKYYATVRKAFETVREHDGHVLTLKEAGASPVTAEAGKPGAKIPAGEKPVAEKP